MSGSGRWSQVLNVLSAWKSNRNLCNLVLLSAVAGSGSLGRAAGLCRFRREQSGDCRR